MSWRTMIVGLAVLSLAACLAPLEPDVGALTAGTCDNEDSNPDADVSFQNDILPRLHAGCGCHNPIPPSRGSAIDSTGFSVGDHTSLLRGGQISREQIVVPGAPCESQLYQKLSDAPPSGARMPIYGPYWSRLEMQLLSDWIAEGARAN